MDKRNLLNPSKKCPKIVRVSKYERVHPETREWWWNQFRKLEYEKSIPLYKKISYLQKCFPKQYLADLIDMGIDIYHESNENILDLIIEENKALRLSLQSKVTPEKQLKNKEFTPKYTNPYLRYMGEDPENIQVWKPRRKKRSSAQIEVLKKGKKFDEELVEEIEKMDLLKKAKQVEENIAAQYEQWFNRQGTRGPSRITRETILFIFQTLYHGQMSKSIKRLMREVDAVPLITAMFMDSYDHSEEARLLEEVQKDISLSRGKPKNVAFGKCLPKELRRKPTAENLEEKWLKFEREGQQDLATMAAVWQGITHLQSTRSFCAWLADHPEITPPIYLQEVGLMEECNYNQSAADDIEDIIFNTSVINIVPFNAFEEAAQNIKINTNI